MTFSIHNILLTFNGHDCFDSIFGYMYYQIYNLIYIKDFTNNIVRFLVCWAVTMRRVVRKSGWRVMDIF